jgi:hypothetical protein
MPETWHWGASRSCGARCPIHRRPRSAHLPSEKEGLQEFRLWTSTRAHSRSSVISDVSQFLDGEISSWSVLRNRPLAVREAHS